jgi:hypothetical protein
MAGIDCRFNRSTQRRLDIVGPAAPRVLASRPVRPVLNLEPTVADTGCHDGKQGPRRSVLPTSRQLGNRGGRFGRATLAVSPLDSRKTPKQAGQIGALPGSSSGYFVAMIEEGAMAFSVHEPTVCRAEHLHLPWNPRASGIIVDRPAPTRSIPYGAQPGPPWPGSADPSAVNRRLVASAESPDHVARSEAQQPRGPEINNVPVPEELALVADRRDAEACDLPGQDAARRRVTLPAELAIEALAQIPPPGFGARRPGRDAPGCAGSDASVR